MSRNTAEVEARAIQKCQRCVTPHQLAEIMHETYERQALIEGWTTQESCRVPFAELPEANKRVMLAVAKAVLWATPDLSKMEAEVERRGAARLQQRVAAWVRSRIGDEHMQPKERALRLLEETCELAQAHGIPQESAIKQVEHVFSRPAGEPTKEAAGVAVCLLGWCEATEQNVLDLTVAEIERIEAKPISQIRGSVARKAGAGLIACEDGAAELETNS